MIVWVLMRKLLRDLRVAWFITALLLFLFQLLWARITQRVTTNILRQFDRLGVSPDAIKDIIFDQNELPGRMVQAIIGGEDIRIDNAQDMMTISYVHPLVMTILCVWAVGRAANAIAGEIDRGTMELLLAQPIRRSQVILAHFLVDVIAFAALCGVIWMGTYCGTWLMGLDLATNPARQFVDPLRFRPALLAVLGLLFSVSGLTMWISSMGRSRARVWGWAVSIVLTMFLANVLGQIWSDQIGWLRPFTIFHHYQPQPMILHVHWYEMKDVWLHLLALGGVGAGGYALAWMTFCHRDLPAPL